jgi:DNA-binding response OmpR family regulator
VLCDVELPGMDGFAVCAAIRATPAVAATPVAILTSRDSAEDHRRGLEAGVDAYMVKSGFDQQELLATVRRLLGQGPGS